LVAGDVAEHDRVIGSNPVEVVAGRVTGFGEAVLVVGQAADPPSGGRVGYLAGDQSGDLSDARRLPAVDPEASHDPMAEVVVGVDEPGHHDTPVEIDDLRSIAGSRPDGRFVADGEHLAVSHGHRVVAAAGAVQGEHRRVVEHHRGVSHGRAP
jgi:hypothetical protein